MSILDQKSKKVLVESMRKHLCGILQESTTLKADQRSTKQKFVNESATYEQLLNITINPDREQNYLPSYVLEGAVAILHRACFTGRRTIGKNAIKEGALRLQKETGAVITESMLSAALNTVQRGNGLKIVGDMITEDLKNVSSKKVVSESLADFDAILQMMRLNPTLDKLDPRGRTIVSRHLEAMKGSAGNFGSIGGAFDYVSTYLNNGGDVAGLRKMRPYIVKMDELANQINQINNNLKTTGLSDIYIQRLKLARAQLASQMGKEQLKVIKICKSVSAPTAARVGNGLMHGFQSGGFTPQTLERLNQSGGGGNMLKKAALVGGGALATLGGLWAYNRMKQNQ